MPKYNVDKAFWRGGRLIEAGGSVTMSEAEAKYLGHILSKEGAQVAKPTPAPAPADEPAPAPVLAAVVEEKPVVTGHGKRRRSAESQHAVQSN